MSRPIDRLFAIDGMIRSGEYPSIADIMRRFAISERAAYGDIQYLKRRFRAPVAFSRKHGGYYYALATWSLATAAMPLPAEEQNRMPSQWLWNEIARRFGQEAAHALHRDYVRWLVPQQERHCFDCGKPLLPTNNNKRCSACYRRLRDKSDVRPLDAVQRPHQRPCQACGKPREPQRKKWCAACAHQKQREYSQNWYRNLPLERREQRTQRIVDNELRRRWEDDEWHKTYNAQRRIRRRKNAPE